jgi:NADPH-dependent 2,4-dienoyl-CoA reductase/sulfur reductase-like enzyme
LLLSLSTSLEDLSAAQVACARRAVKAGLTRASSVRQASSMTRSAPQGYYAASAPHAPPMPRLSGKMRTDVCIIGGGYTGLSAALHLAIAGAKVVLLEAREMACVSGRNGGQAHPGHLKSGCSRTLA